MATGICYTWSGNKKKYESEQLGSVPTYVTGYTVGYPSTAYYPDIFLFGPNFHCFAYPGPPGFPMYPGFTEGTAEYLYYVSFDWIDSETNTGTKIYNLMSYTPPDGYELDKNGPYTYTAIATVYSYNVDIKYGNSINTINGGTETIKREFKYKKKPIPNDYKKYYVTFTLYGNTLNCSCGRITSIPGTNNGDFTLGIGIELSDGAGTERQFNFEWKMKNGINENRYCNVPYYYGSGFTTRNTWESTRSDGSKVYFSFEIDHSSIPDPPHTINETSTEEISSDDET